MYKNTFYSQRDSDMSAICNGRQHDGHLQLYKVDFQKSPIYTG